MPGPPGPGKPGPRASWVPVTWPCATTAAAPWGAPEDFQFVVEDVLEEYREAQPEFAEMEAPIDKEGAEFFLNQNSREPVTEPDEMVPLWKILHLAGADWTYGSKGWAAENYCMFLADDEAWEHITRTNGQAGRRTGVQGLSQYRVRARHLLGPGRTEKIQHCASNSRSRASTNIMPSGSVKAN